MRHTSDLVNMASFLGNGDVTNVICCVAAKRRVNYHVLWTAMYRFHLTDLHIPEPGGYKHALL